jgi:hypothetical protein
MSEKELELSGLELSGLELAKRMSEKELELSGIAGFGRFDARMKDPTYTQNKEFACPKLVIIESPFGSDDPAVLEENKRYCDACLRDSLNRGESPFASHRVYTRVLDDNVPEQRRKAMEAGFAWMRKAADLVTVYVDRGISEGMMKGIERASGVGKRIEFRKVVGWEETHAKGGDDHAMRNQGNEEAEETEGR